MDPHPQPPSGWTREVFRPPAGLESLRVRLGVLAFWVGLGLAEAGKEWVSAQARGSEVGIGTELVLNLPWWMYWAFVTPLVFGLARRFDVTAPPRWIPLGLHLVLGLVVSLVHLLLVTSLAWFALVRGGDFVYGTFGSQFGFLAGGYVVLDLVFYGLLVAAFHTLRARRALAEGRLREGHYREQAARAEARAAEARLSALRMELNPHFLFNALNAVGGLVRMGDSRAATTMLARLSELLRLTLRPPAEREVALEKELELLNRYLEIEQVRFGDRLTVEIDVPDALRQALVPPFILQPLVENAIRHGVGKRTGPVGVTLKGEVDETGVLSLLVEDSGPGFDPPAVEMGTGLSNVQARLFELYGPEASLVLESVPTHGARARIRMPLKWADPAHEVGSPSLRVRGSEKAPPSPVPVAALSDETE